MTGMRLRWMLAGLLVTVAICMLLSVPGAEAATDLEPRNMTIDPIDPQDGEVIEAEFEVHNNGEHPDPAFNVTVRVWIDNQSAENLIHEEVLDLVTGGLATKVAYTWPANGAGGHTFIVNVDPDDEIVESDEDNNNLTFDFHVYSGPVSELRFSDDSSIVVTPSEPAVNDPVDISIFFQNDGRGDANYFHIRYEAIIDNTTTEIATIEITNLPGGANGQANVTWNPTQAGNYTLRVILDSADELEEPVEDNNTQELEIFVRIHTPELTPNAARGITLTPVDAWLTEPFQNHEIWLMAEIFNEDPYEVAHNVTVWFYDQPANGSRQPIGNATILTITNGTRIDDNIIPGSAQVTVRWGLATGTALAGNHTLFIEIDPDGEIDEWNRDDNNLSQNVTLLEPRPDLTVVEVRAPGEHVIGIPSLIEATLYNRGSLGVLRATVELRVEFKLTHTWEVTLGEGNFTNVSYQYVWVTQDNQLNVECDPDEEIDELDDDNNVGSERVLASAPKVDVTLRNLTHDRELFYGHNLVIDITVHNQLAAISRLQVSLKINNVSAELWNMDENFAYNETRVLRLQWNASSGSGLQNLTVAIMPLNVVSSDLNLSDNLLTSNFTIKLRQYELYLDPPSIKPREAFLNQTITITVFVRNSGPDVLANGTAVLLYVLDTDHQEQKRTGSLDRVVGFTMVRFTWTPPVPGNYTIRVVVDPENEIDEPDETNNQALGFANVSYEEVVDTTPAPVSEDDSFLRSPMLWLPFLILLALAVGVGALIKLRKQGDYMAPPTTEVGEGWTPPVLDGVDSQVCLACLSMVPEDDGYRCDCGRVYHFKCITKSIACQHCGAIFKRSDMMGARDNAQADAKDETK